MAKTYDLVVIGTGVAAMKIAEICRGAGWSVAIIDRRPYGGTCMLRGCDPKKLLWGVAASVDQARRFAKAGVTPGDIALDWPALMRFKRGFIAEAPSTVENELRNLGIDTFHGTAHFVSRNAVAVDGDVLEARHVAIASGSKPATLSMPGADALLTSDDFLDLDELPNSLAFVGGGYIAFEFAHIAARAGAKITIIHENESPLGHFDRELVSRLIDKSRRIGIDIRLGSPVESIGKADGGLRLRTGDRLSNATVEAAAAVHGAGRVPDIDDLALDAAGVEKEDHRLRLTPQLQSVSNANVYAAGDAAARGPMLTPVSRLDGEAVAHNLLEGGQHHAPDYNGVPGVVFTIPPLAAVGLTEQQARDRNLKFRVAQADASGWYTARRVREDSAAFKVLIEDRTNRILGAHILGPNAEEVINLFGTAIRLGLTADQLRRVVPAYPSDSANIAYMLG